MVEIVLIDVLDLSCFQDLDSVIFCRSGKELANEPSLAKIGVDTAENEPSRVRMWRPHNLQAY